MCDVHVPFGAPRQSNVSVFQTRAPSLVSPAKDFDGEQGFLAQFSVFM